MKPLKKAKQYERLPPGSPEDEQELVLFDNCWSNAPTGTGLGPPVPPVNVVPEGVAVNEAFAKLLLCVTAVESG